MDSRPRPAAASGLQAVRGSTRLVGWVVLPLRLFLGVTFCFAGLQKLADPQFFNSHSPTSIQSQLRGTAGTSPLGGMLSASAHHAVLIGMLIALAELAVGVGALLGLWTRVAALGGMALSLGFLLAVSWHASPYYLGPDIVFLVAWSPLAVAGAGNVLSLDHRLHNRARKDLKLAPAGTVAIEFAAVRKLCGAYSNGSCELRARKPCDAAVCPVLLSPPRLKPATAAELDRRTFLRQAGAASIAAAGALTLAGLSAGIGRLIGGHNAPARLAADGRTSPPDSSSTTVPAPTSTTTAQRAAARAPTTTAAPPPPPRGVPVARAADVPVGGALRFHDPRSGGLAYLVQPRAGQFAAFSGICTHQGCGVQYYGSAFVCPCHGAEFSATSGSVLRGPARQPLAEMVVAVGADGRVYVDG